MGYALLYEAMLDSVLFARDMFLRPGGIMAPSQCRIMGALAEIPAVMKEHVTFWDEVYGFKMSSMAVEVYDEAVIEIVPAKSMISNVVTLKDLPLQRITTRQLDFRSPFAFESSREGKAHALLVYFDTWFTVNGADIPLDAKVTITPGNGDVVTTDVLRLARKPSYGATAHALAKAKAKEEAAQAGREVSFSTGPESMPTHWKQTLFLLRKPIELRQGTKVSGMFHCQKSSENSRELDIEVHYQVDHPHASAGTVVNTEVQMFKVR